jgi:hypothetical protein
VRPGRAGLQDPSTSRRYRPFFIADDEDPIRMRSSGRLYLGINDDYLQDNRGSFRMIVAY